MSDHSPPTAAGAPAGASTPPAPRRVLMICERFPPDLGGLARSGARVAQALARLGARVDVLALTRRLPPGALESGLAPDGPAAGPAPTVHRLGVFGQLDLTLQHAMNVLEWLQAEIAADLVWGHYLFPSGFLATLFAGAAGLPVTVSARGNDVDRLTFPPGDFARLTWTLDRADLVTVVSADLARKIRLLVGRDLPLMVVPNAVDPEVFAPGPGDPELRGRLGLAPREAVLGFCGELRHKKGGPFLLAALREVRAHRPACLLLIGEARPREQAQLADFAAAHPEDGARVVVTGHLEAPAAVAAHLRLCDVVLFPSLWDGLPNALLEAMACARPCLASDAGGLPEALVPETGGLVVPRTQLHRLGEAVRELLDLPAERRAALGAAARARALAAYHPEVEAAALAQVLARLTPRTSS